MSASYRLDPEARRELVASMAFDDAREEGLGLEFLDEFRAVAQRAARFSEAGTVVSGSPTEVPIRRYLFQRFEHALYTLFLGGELFIFAVAHQRQRPGYWRRRLAKTKP
jgi:toxin ParE1/3/4